MRRVSLASTALLLALVAVCARADDTKQAKDSGSDPFKFSFGLQQNGGIGASLKGDDVRVLGGGAGHAWFLLSTIDAQWNSKVDAADQTRVAVQPGVVLWAPRAGLYYDLAATIDVSQRFGEFKTTDGTVDDINQTLVGATLIWIPRPLQTLADRFDPPAPADVEDCWYKPEGCPNVKALPTEAPPRVTLTYYHPVDHSKEVGALPEGIEADKIVGKFTGDVRLTRSPVLRASHLRLMWDLSLTYPTTGDRDLQQKIDVGLGVRFPKLTPVIRYVSGSEGGFKYDRQFLLGLLWRVAGLPAQ